MEYIKIKDKLNKERTEILNNGYNIKELMELNYKTIISILDVLLKKEGTVQEDILEALKKVQRESCKRIEDNVNKE